jgi:5-methylcytosine-specific restriction endonuclease McrA
MGKFSEFYRTKKWSKIRQSILIRDNFLCQVCKRKGKYQSGNIVHHKEHLTSNNIKNYSIAYGDKNLETVCQDCHNVIHNEFTNGLDEFLAPP